MNVASESKFRKILMAACAAVLASSAAASAAEVTWSGANANNNLWSTATNWAGNTAPIAHDSLVFDGFARLSPNNDFLAGTAFDGITFAPTAGPFNLVGNQITLSGNINDNTPVLPQTISLAMLLDGNRDVSVTDNGFLTIGGIVSGSGFGITKSGNGTLVLTGANTFGGTLGINGGVVSVSSDGNLGATTAAANRLVIDGGILRTTATMTMNAGRGMLLGNAGGGGGTIEVNTGTTLTYGGVIANNGAAPASLNKINFGGLTLFGANTYTGATRVSNGTVTLDFNQASAPVSNIINNGISDANIGTGSTLILGGRNAGLGATSFAQLFMVGKASTNNTQAFNNTSVDIGPAIIRATSGTSGSSVLKLGALTHTTGGTLVLARPAAGNIFTTSTNSNGTTGAANGIIGSWATIGPNTPQVVQGISMGTDWASVAADGSIVPYTGYSNYTGGNLAGAVTNATNLRVDATTAGNIVVDTPHAGTPEDPGTVTDLNTFQLAVNTNNLMGRFLDIGANNTLRFGAQGGFFRADFTTPDPAAGNPRAFIIGTPNTIDGGLQDVGTLTAGGAPNTPGEIMINWNAPSQTGGSLNVEAKITDNGTGQVSVVKAGPGTMKFRGHNTYSGNTYILQGRFQLAGSEIGTANPDGFGTGSVYVMPGAQFFPSGIGGLPNGAGGQVPFSNPLFLAGFGISADNTGAIRMPGGGAIMSGQITLTGDARIGGGGTASYAINAAGTALNINNGNNITGKITGNYNMDFGATGNAGGSGTNVWLLNSANDWTGHTTIVGRTGGTAGNAVLHLGANEVIPDGVGKGNMQFGNTGNTNSTVTLNMNGFNETVNGLSTATAVQTALSNIFIENNGFTATIVDDGGVKSYVFAPTTSTLTVGNYDQTATFGGTIRDNHSNNITLPDPSGTGTISVLNPAQTAGSKMALTKIGEGVQTLSGVNTYSGDTNINNGTLAITGQLALNGKVNINSSASSAGTLSGTGIVGDVVMAATVGGYKATLAPGVTGAVGSVGTISLNSLTVNGGDIAIDVGQGTSDVISVTSVARFNGASTVSPGASGTAGDYTILVSNNPIVYNVTPTLVAPTLTRSTFSLDTTGNPNALILKVIGGSKTLTWTGTANGRWDIVGFQNWTDGVQAERFFNGDTVTFGDVNTNRNLLLDATVLPGSVTFSNSSAGDYTLSGVGTIAGSTNFSKSGNGKVTISTNNTNTGQTQISEGTVQVGTGGTSGSLGTGNIVNNGTLIFNRSDNITINQTIDGNGDLKKQGVGVLRLGGINSYNGGTAIEQGSILVTNSNSLGNFGGEVIISSGAALDLSGDGAANDLNFQGTVFRIAGSGIGATGALTNSGNVGQQNAFQNVVLTDNASVGGTGRFDLRGGVPVLDLAGHTLTKVGTNQVTLVNTDVTDGNIVVNEGVFAIETGTSIPDNGTGTTITYNAGTTAQFFGNAPRDGSPGSSVARPMVLNGGVTIGNGSNNDAATIGSNITLGGNLTVGVLNGANDATLRLLGNIGESGGARSVTKNGTTTLVLSGNSTYSGGTTVNAGTLRVNNTAGSATGTGPVALGTDVTLVGNGTIAGTVSVSGTAHVVPGDGTISTLTLGGLSLSEGSSLDMEGAATSFDLINLTGTNTLTFSGNALLNLTETAGLNEGSFTLIDYSGTPIGSLAGKLTLSNSVFGGLNATLFDDAINTAIKVKLENPNGSPQWTVDANGSWTEGSNWSSGTVPDGATGTARFLGAITAPRTVALNGDRTIGTLVFDNANKYTIAPGSGGQLTIGDASNVGGITVANGGHEISAQVNVAGAPLVDVAQSQSLYLSGGVAIAAGRTLTKTGQGTLRLGAGIHSAGAALVAQQGTVQLDQNQGNANVAAGSNLAINVVGNAAGAASTVLLNEDQDLSSLSISTADAGTQTLDLNSPAGAGLFHAVRVYAADLNAAKASLSAAIRNAATSVTDPLDGIVDSGLHTGAKIGVAITGDHVTIRSTRIGDLNLDGSVSISDFIDLASNFNASNKTWQEGDLNDDGNVTISDFIDLASNFNSSYAGSLGPINPQDQLTLASFASSVGVDPAIIGSAVPEPASLSLLAVGAVGLLRRRRRKD